MLEDETVNNFDTSGIEKARLKQYDDLISNYEKGEEVIGSFNPSGDHHVEAIKSKAKELVNLIECLGRDPRRKATAITNIEQGVMWAVKSLFH